MTNVGTSRSPRVRAASFSSFMLIFLAVEFLFYLWNTIGEVIHGYGFFFHLANPNLLLRAVFAIGYVNLFASGYFLALLLLKKSHFFNAREDVMANYPPENSDTHAPCTQTHPLLRQDLHP